MTDKCKATTLKGSPCRGEAYRDGLCHTHHPDDLAKMRLERVEEWNERHAAARTRATNAEIEAERAAHRMRQYEDKCAEISTLLQRTDAAMLSALDVARSLLLPVGYGPSEIDILRARALIEWHTEARISKHYAGRADNPSGWKRKGGSSCAE